MKKYFISILTLLILLVSCFSPYAIADDDIIELYTAEDLFALRDNMSAHDNYTEGKTVELMQDIDLLGEEFIPIGYSKENTYTDKPQAFKGIFNGNEHAIKNFTITSADYDTAALFALAKDAYFGDLTVSGAVIAITNDAEDSEGIVNAAAICGKADNTDFYNCSAYGSISVTEIAEDNTDPSRTGLICGALNGSVLNSYAEGEITVSANRPVYAGGIIGWHDSSNYNINIISDSISNVNIDISSTANSYSAFAGGIIGVVHSDDQLLIRGCKYSTDYDNPVHINGNGFKSLSVGGITPRVYAQMSNCETGIAEISVHCETGSGRGGGIATSNYGTIKNCTSSARVSVTSNSASSSYAAGIVCSNGAAHNTAEDPAEANEISIVENCTFTEDGSVYLSCPNAANSVGGIVSLAYPTSHIKMCYSASSNLNFGASKTLYISPIAGLVQGGIVEQCSASGSLKPDGTVSSTLYIGGITGDLTCENFYRYNEYGETEYIIDGGIIENCFADMEITAKAKAIQAGGIAGYVYGKVICTNNQPTVKSSKFIGNIDIVPTSTSFAGGIAGYSVDGTVENCYSEGSISEAAPSPTSAMIFIGGCIGRIKQNNATVSDPISIVKNCYTLADTALSGNASKAKAGTFTSESSANSAGLLPSVTSCYFLGGKEHDNDVAEPITSDELISPESFDGWDFKETWYISDTQPRLTFEQPAILGYNSEKDANGAVVNVKSIDTASLIGTDILYIVVYDFEGKLESIKSFDMRNNKNAFLTIDCDMYVPYSAGAIRIFAWSDKMVPLLDAYDIPITD